jgi:hypothetical protein
MAFGSATYSSSVFAGARAYILIGQQYEITAAAGVYGYTGNTASLKLSAKGAVQAGVYALAGKPMSFTYQRKLTAEAGVYSLSPSAVILKALEVNGWEIPGTPIDHWMPLGTGGGDWLEVNPLAGGWTRV